MSLLIVLGRDYPSMQPFLLELATQQLNDVHPNRSHKPNSGHDDYSRV